MAGNPLCTPKLKARTQETHPTHIKRLQDSPNAQVLIIGSSMIERFETSGKSEIPRLTEKYQCVLAGVGGDGIEHMLWRVNQGLIEACPASIKTIILMAGTNNIEKHNVDQVFAGIVNLIKTIHEKNPGLQIKLFGLPARDSTVKKLTNEALMTKIKDLNTKLATLDGTNNIQFFNFFNKLTKNGLEKDAAYFDDHVHFNSAAYKIFGAEIYKILDQQN